ncbi:MAG: DUF4239 domain-containing protein [Thermoleophilia bacterium]|nr:DUF4239 domain-containing protein [Thermoleophilia bacterium]
MFVLALLTIALVAAAVAAGILLGRGAWRRRRGDTGLVGLEVKDLPTPLFALAGLLVAFVLVTTYTDWKSARSAAAREARALAAELATLSVTPGAPARAATAALTCYGRSVVALEWPAMGERTASPVTAAWSVDADRRYARLLRGEGAALAEAALTDRGVRVDARLERLAAAQASVPAPLTALLVAAVVLGVGLLAFLAHPAIRPVILVPVLVATALLFGGALLLIQDMDRPFSGPIATGPSAMAGVVEGPGAAARPPCDAEGRPQ